MGFSFRKSKTFGPFRLTASKGGLSGSVGSRNARLGITSKGRKRASAGRSGIRWSKVFK